MPSFKNNKLSLYWLEQNSTTWVQVYQYAVFLRKTLPVCLVGDISPNSDVTNPQNGDVTKFKYINIGYNPFNAFL